MLHQPRYMESLLYPPAAKSPLCLRYIIMALATAATEDYKDMAMAFYQKARNIAEANEMLVGSLHHNYNHRPLLDLLTLMVGPAARLHIISPCSMLVPDFLL